MRLIQPTRLDNTFIPNRVFHIIILIPNVKMLRILAPALLSLSGVLAARTCSNETTAATVQWRQGDVSFDGAEPNSKTGFATIAISVQPEGRGAVYECVAQWPESWQGYVADSSAPLWSDCVWTGSGPTLDTTTSFAVDWKTKTLYFSHSYGCSSAEGQKGLATGTMDLNVTCSTTDTGSNRCFSTGASIGNTRPLFNTTQAVTPKGAPACCDYANRYQSWEVTDWTREYQAQSPSDTGAPKGDTGPLFSLRNLGAGGEWECKTTGSDAGVFAGSCEGGWMPGAKAMFAFDANLNILSITESMGCASDSFEAKGSAYIQATCDRFGDKMVCYDDEPVWVGTKLW